MSRVSQLLTAAAILNKIDAQWLQTVTAARNADQIPLPSGWNTSGLSSNTVSDPTPTTAVEGHPHDNQHHRRLTQAHTVVIEAVLALERETRQHQKSRLMHPQERALALCHTPACNEWADKDGLCLHHYNQTHYQARKADTP